MLTNFGHLENVILEQKKKKKSRNELKFSSFLSGKSTTHALTSELGEHLWESTVSVFGKNCAKQKKTMMLIFWMALKIISDFGDIPEFKISSQYYKLFSWMCPIKVKVQKLIYSSNWWLWPCLLGCVVVEKSPLIEFLSEIIKNFVFHEISTKMRNLVFFSV